ncbi:MAG: antibiotic biosynthesis monooxygenase family protein [Smithellaceae bacterium]
MILVTIKMNVLPEKNKELSQTLASLVRSIEADPGCRGCDFYRRVEDENAFALLEQWDSDESFKGHLSSEHYRVIRGTVNLLRSPHEINVHAGLYPGRLGRF